MVREDIESVNQDPRTAQFFIPASKLTVVELEMNGQVLIRGEKGDCISLSEELLRKTCEPVPGKKVSIPRFDVRALKKGDRLDDIPLVRCPICKRTALSLGKNLDYLFRESKYSSYAHIVGDLTASSGSVFLVCDEAFYAEMSDG